MDWALMVPVDGAVLRKAVFEKLSELTPVVHAKMEKFSCPIDVFEETQEGKEHKQLSAYSEAIPKSGLCYISADLARYLCLITHMDSEELRLNSGLTAR